MRRASTPTGRGPSPAPPSGGRARAGTPLVAGVLALGLALAGPPSTPLAATGALAADTRPRPEPSAAEAREAGRLREEARRLQGEPRTFEYDPNASGGGVGTRGTGEDDVPPPDEQSPPDEQPQASPVETPTWLLWLLVGLLVVALLLAVWFMLRRRTRGDEATADPDAVAVAETEAERLEREADEAEARGAHDAAVRLRFRAGVLRLRAREALGPAPVTAQDVARAVPGDASAALVADLEAVAYAGRAGTPEASAAARERWPRVHHGGDDR